MYSFLLLMITIWPEWFFLFFYKDYSTDYGLHAHESTYEKCLHYDL